MKEVMLSTQSAIDVAYLKSFFQREELNYYEDLEALKWDEVEIETPPVIVNGRTLVPLRFIAEIIGFEVDWDSDSGTIFLISETNKEANGNYDNAKTNDRVVVETGTVIDDLTLSSGYTLAQSLVLVNGLNLNYPRQQM